MPTRISSGFPRLVIPLLSLSLVGCAGFSFEDVLAGGAGTGNSLSGEVRGVDTRRQQIEVRSTWGGSERVAYDSRTQVVHRQQRYPVTSLERGDVVRMRVARDRRGGLYTNRIDVQQTVQERRGRGTSAARLQRFEGSVGRIDSRNGWFELRPPRGSTIVVTLPYQPGRAVQDRFRRLRGGQAVRIEGELLNSSRVELHRFL